MRKKCIILFAFVFLLVLPMLNAVPPFEQKGDFTTGYSIEFPPIGVLKQGQDFNFSFHVFNISTGMPVSAPSVVCDYHLGNSSGQVLTTKAKNVIDHVINEWEVFIDKGNFSLLGEYGYVIQCNSTSLGGFESIGIDVTQTGHQQTTGEAIGSAIFMILFIFLTIFFVIMGFKLSSTENLWVLGIFFLFMALIFIVYDVYLGFNYYTNYVGADNTSKIPEIIFVTFFLSLIVGLLVSAILLFKKIPEVLKWLKVHLGGKSEDGWDEERY